MLKYSFSLFTRSKFVKSVKLINITSFSTTSTKSIMSEFNHPKQAEYNTNNLFAKILRSEIPCKSIYEDTKCLAFHDINPQAPVHFLVIPKIELSMLENMEDSHSEIIGHCLYIANKIAKDLKLENGYRVVINNGPDGCQSVYHLHIHVMGGRQLGWPPG